MIRMKVVRSLSSMKTWKFEKGGPCEKGETASKTGCTPASGEGTKKEGKKPKKSSLDSSHYKKQLEHAVNYMKKNKDSMGTMESVDLHDHIDTLSKLHNRHKDLEKAISSVKRLEEKESSSRGRPEWERKNRSDLRFYKGQIPKIKKEIKRIEAEKSKGVANNIDKVLGRGKGGEKKDKVAKVLSPADAKHQKSVEGKMKRALRKVKSLEKSRQEMKKWHKGQPQGAIDKWNKAMDLEIEKHEKIAEISKKHLEKYYG